MVEKKKNSSPVTPESDMGEVAVLRKVVAGLIDTVLSIAPRDMEPELAEAKKVLGLTPAEVRHIYSVELLSKAKELVNK